MIFNFKGEKVFYMVKQHIITLNIAWHEIVTLSHEGMVGKHLLLNQEKKAFLGVTCVNHSSKLLGGIMGQVFPLRNLGNGPTIPWPWFFFFFFFSIFWLKKFGEFFQKLEKKSNYITKLNFSKNKSQFFCQKNDWSCPKKILS